MTALRQRPVNANVPLGRSALGSPSCRLAFPDAPASSLAAVHDSFASSHRSFTIEDDEEEQVPAVRLSRNIPRREEMDMSVSAYNLMGTHTHGSPINHAVMASGSSPLLNGVTPRSAVLGTAHAVTAASSVFTDSQISDDSSYMTSLYNDMLADKLISQPVTHDGLPRMEDTCRHISGRGSNGDGARDSDSNPSLRRGIGGEVLRFADSADWSPSSGQRSVGSPLSITGGGGSLSRTSRIVRAYAAPSGAGATTRVLSTNPERVLDAPGFPADSRQLVDWGSNNKIIIGLRSSLYAWDAATRQASKITELSGGLQVSAVHWVHRCDCVALCMGHGTAAIYDCRRQDYLRTMRLPAGMKATAMSANGPILAISSNSPTGCTQAFDLRAKNALIATYEGHQGPVATVQYCTSEPFYLATGGHDGHVRIWDMRRSHGVRYAFDNVHQGPVSALHWNPDKRSRLFTGGQDGVLCHVDTHATSRLLADDQAVDEESSVLLGAHDSEVRRGTTVHCITRAVKTTDPITSLICNGGEVLTSHSGRGHLQLRHTSSLHLKGTFTSPNSTAGLCCLTLAPDRERVCVAQGDETVKIWRVFDAAASTSTNARGSTYRDSSAGLEQPLR